MKKLLPAINACRDEIPFDIRSFTDIYQATCQRLVMSDPDDQAFFQHLIQTHYQDLYRFAFSLSKQPDDASDLVQQTFTIWATKGHQLLDRSKAKSWLFTTLHREFIRLHKKEGDVLLLNEVEAKKLGDTASYTPALDNIIDGKAVLEALHEMEPTFGDPMRLFYLSDLNYREIAKVLDIPVGTVMSRLSRGKAILRTQLLSTRKP